MSSSSERSSGLKSTGTAGEEKNDGSATAVVHNKWLTMPKQSRSAGSSGGKKIRDFVEIETSAGGYYKKIL